MRPTHALVCLTLAATIGASAQTTQPAKKAEPLTVSVWTCPEHQQLRMTGKGACPICEQTLVRSKVAIGGGETPWGLYPLTTCPVSGLVLGSKGAPVIWMHEGREVRFCCGGCIEKFQADPKAYLEKIDGQIVSEQLAHYPLTTCPVSKEPLDAMGGPVNQVYNNRLVRFCCKGCLRSFRKDTAAYLAELDQAVIAAQGERYPLATCPISGEKLGSMGKPVEIVVGNRLVRFCCAGCVGTFYKAPGEHLAKLEEAWAKAGPAPGKGDAHEEGHDHDHDHDH